MVSMCTMVSMTELSHRTADLHSASSSPTTSSSVCIGLHSSRRQLELCSLASASSHRSLRISLSFQRSARRGRSVAVRCSGAAEEIQSEKAIAAYNSRTNVLSSGGGLLQRLAGIFIGSALLVASLGLGYARPVLARPSPVETLSTVSEEEPSLEEESELESTPSDAVEEVKEKDPAELVLLSYLERHPEDVKALEGLMYIRLRKGSIAKALETVDTLLALRPDHAPWQLIRAQALEFLGDLDAARHAFEFILETDPLSARALQGLATVMSKAGEGTEAIEMLQRAIQTAVEAGKIKETKNLRMLLGQMYTLQGYLQEALAEYQELEREDSRDFRPYLCQGLVYSLLDQKEDADKAFMKYRRRRPQTFGERGYLDDLMIGAKTEARKIDLEERQQKIKAGKKKKSKPMKQPDIETAVDPDMAEEQE